MEHKISVVINTYNAEEHLVEVLESVKLFDEIVICDMESTDSTLQIANDYNCKIVTFKKGDYTIVEHARNFAITSAAHEWVLVVDADEVVTPALREYLYEIIQQKDCPDGLFIPRKNYFMGKFMQCLYPDYILRFFRQALTNWPAIIHVQPTVKGRVEYIPKGNLNMAFEHLAKEDISTRLRKIDVYTDNEIDKKAGKKYNTLSLFWRPFLRFFKAYILKCGWRDGKAGLIRAGLEGVYQFIMISKIEERYTNNKNK